MTSHGRTTAGTGLHTARKPRLAEGAAAAGYHRQPPVAGEGAALAATFAAQWPCRSYLELGALPGAVPCARLHAREVLWEWGLAALSDSIELVVSEFVTNAVRASRAAGQPAVRIWLVTDQAQVVVFVWDASPRPPAPAADPGADAENGRGLLLVEALSERWGYFKYNGSGKVVWAALEALLQPMQHSAVSGKRLNSPDVEDSAAEPPDWSKIASVMPRLSGRIDRAHASRTCGEAAITGTPCRGPQRLRRRRHAAGARPGLHDHGPQRRMSLLLTVRLAG